MEHAELIETAGVNFLLQLDPATYPWPGSMLNSKGQAWRIFPGENDRLKDGQSVLFMIEGEPGEEYPPCSGNRWATVRVEVRTPFQIQTSDQAALNLPTPLQNHSAAAATLAAAISRQDFPDQLTAAVPGLTVFGLDGNREPIREQTEFYWMSGWRIKLYSGPFQDSAFIPAPGTNPVSGTLWPILDNTGAVVYLPMKDVVTGQQWYVYVGSGLVGMQLNHP